jgi:hypothetical protein
MKKGRGKFKGHGFERRLANVLTKWSGYAWKRVPLSGGWNKIVVSGDIFCVAEYGRNSGQERIVVPFSLECKCSESWDFVHFFKDSEKSPLYQWWQQASSDAKQAGKLPAMIFTKNFLPVFIMLHVRTLNKLAKLVGFSWKKFTYLSCQISQEQLAVLLLDDFLGWIDFRVLLKLTV